MKKASKQPKSVLGLSSHIDYLLEMEKKLMDTCPHIHLYKAITYEDGLQLMLSFTFDLVVLEVSREPGARLLDLALRRKFPLLVLSEKGEIIAVLQCLNGAKIKGVVPKSADTVVSTIEQVLKTGNTIRCRDVLQKLYSRFAGVVGVMSPRKIYPSYYTDSNSRIYY